MPRPCAAETGERLAEPEAVEVVRERQVLRAVDLVRGDDDRDVAAAQDVRDLGVAGAHPGAGVDHEQRDLGVRQGFPRLVLDGDGERVLVVQVHAAGVDQRERPAVPVRRELLAVTRDPGALVDDGLPALGEPVDEG